MSHRPRLDTVLASACRAQVGRNKEGCHICVTVRLPVGGHGETMYWQAHANTVVAEFITDSFVSSPKSVSVMEITWNSREKLSAVRDSLPTFHRSVSVMEMNSSGSTILYLQLECE